MRNGEKLKYVLTRAMIMELAPAFPLCKYYINTRTATILQLIVIEKLNRNFLILGKDMQLNILY
jgi:hypothetical protein